MSEDSGNQFEHDEEQKEVCRSYGRQSTQVKQDVEAYRVIRNGPACFLERGNEITLSLTFEVQGMVDPPSFISKIIMLLESTNG